MQTARQTRQHRDRSLDSPRSLLGGASFRMDRSWTPAQISTRRAIVRDMYHHGSRIWKIATVCGCSRKTVYRDLAWHGLQPYSDVSMDVLEQECRRIIFDTHADRDIGLSKIISRLLEEAGLRVQQARVKEALARCGDIRQPTERRRVRRRQWYDALGPFNVCCMDQNEKLGSWGFKILGAIDGYSRYPLAWTLTPTLTGRNHSELYQRVLEEHKEAPRNVVVDGTQCFNGESITMPRNNKCWCD